MMSVVGTLNCWWSVMRTVRYPLGPVGWVEFLRDPTSSSEAQCWVSQARPNLRNSRDWPVGIRIADVPEQSRHDHQCFAGDGCEQVLIGSVLGTSGIGMRNPDRLEAKHLGKAVIGQ